MNTLELQRYEGTSDSKVLAQLPASPVTLSPGPKGRARVPLHGRARVIDPRGTPSGGKASSRGSVDGAAYLAPGRHWNQSMAEPITSAPHAAMLSQRPGYMVTKISKIIQDAK